MAPELRIFLAEPQGSSCTSLVILKKYGDSKPKADDPVFPPTTCQLEHVTFERFRTHYSFLAELLVGCTDPSRGLHFEMWSMGTGDMEDGLSSVFPVLKSFRVSCYVPKVAFIGKLARNAPQLEEFHISPGGGEEEGTLEALTELLLLKSIPEGSFSNAVETPKGFVTFPKLRRLEYPAPLISGGRGKKARQEEAEEVEERLCAAASRRGIRVTESQAIKYEVEGAQRRAGFAAMARRGW